jgi:hypothetical protein
MMMYVAIMRKYSVCCEAGININIAYGTFIWIKRGGREDEGDCKGKGGQIVGRGMHLALGCRQSKKKGDLTGF